MVVPTETLLVAATACVFCSVAAGGVAYLLRDEWMWWDDGDGDGKNTTTAPQSRSVSTDKERGRPEDADGGAGRILAKQGRKRRKDGGGGGNPSIEKPVLENCPDPGIVYDGTHFYVAGTNPGYGFLGFRSKDALSWKPLGMILEGHGGSNYWAPEIFKYRGSYWLTYTADQRLYIAKSRTGGARGPYVKYTGPLLQRWSIDSHVFVDDDGSPYLFWNESAGVFMARLSPNLRSLDGGETRLFGADTHRESWVTEAINEAPFVIKVGKKYVLFYSGNATGARYGVGYATADSIQGPYVKSKHNPLIQINGSGHASFTKGPGGELVMAYHRHSTPGLRNLHVAKITFPNDFPSDAPVLSRLV